MGSILSFYRNCKGQILQTAQAAQLSRLFIFILKANPAPPQVCVKKAGRKEVLDEWSARLENEGEEKKGDGRRRRLGIHCLLNAQPIWRPLYLPPSVPLVPPPPPHPHAGQRRRRR